MNTRILVAALAAVGVLSACATSSTVSSKNVKVGGPEVSDGSGRGKNGKSEEPVQTEIVPQVSAKAKLTFEDAVKAYDEQKKSGKVDYASLEKRFQAAADADSSLAEADFNLGVLAEKQGKTKEAIAHYKEALGRKKTLRQAAENLAVIMQNQGDEAGAAKVYQQIADTYPDDASSRARLGEIARRHGDLDKAEELCRAALFRDPKTVQAFKTLMLINFEKKQYSMTRLIALRAMKLTDQDPEIYYTLGLVNLAEKEPLKAKVQFKKAIEVRPDYVQAHYELAKMAMAKDDFSGAEEHLRKLLSANGNNPEALVDLGIAYKGTGQLDKALQMYDAAQKLKPDIAAITLNRGIIVGLKGEPEKAIEMYKQYLLLRGGEANVPQGVNVAKLIKDQEAVIQKRIEDKKAAEEAAKMEEEAKKAAAEVEAAEKAQKEEELKRQQAEAKGGAAKDALKDEGAKPGPDSKGTPAKAEEPKKEEKKAPPPPTAAPAPAKAPAAPAAAKKDSDEPSDGL